MSKPGAENQKPDADADRGQTGTARGPKRHSRGSRRAMETWSKPRFRSHTGAAVPVLWVRGCPLRPLSPGAYIYPHGVLQSEIYRALG